MHACCVQSWPRTVLYAHLMSATLALTMTALKRSVRYASCDSPTSTCRTLLLISNSTITELLLLLLYSYCLCLAATALVRVVTVVSSAVSIYTTALKCTVCTMQRRGRAVCVHKPLLSILLSLTLLMLLLLHCGMQCRC
jgi:hypothetical protein